MCKTEIKGSFYLWLKEMQWLGLTKLSIRLTEDGEKTTKVKKVVGCRTITSKSQRSSVEEIKKYIYLCFSDQTDTFNAFGRNLHNPLTVHLRWTFFYLSVCLQLTLFTLAQCSINWSMGTQWEELVIFCMGEIENIKEFCNANFPWC